MFPNGSQPIGGSSIDVTTLTPFNNDVQTVANGTLQTVLEITGKGFLESFYAGNSGGVSLNVRVTVDGVLKVNLASSSSFIATGVVTLSDLIPTSSAGVVGIRNGFTTMPAPPLALHPYPTTSGAQGIILINDAKIYFKKSLLLQVNAPSSTNVIHYRGAFK